GKLRERVGSKPGNLEIRNFVNQAAVLCPERHKPRQVDINAASINESGLRLVISGVVSDAEERVVKTISRMEEQRAHTRKSIWPHSSARRRRDHRFSSELVNIGLDVSFSGKRIEVLLRIASVAVIALHGEPWIEVIAISNKEPTAPGCVVWNVEI